MDGPMSGDIFPAKQAIEMIDQVDLSLPIEIPPVPEEAEPDNVPAEEHRALLAEIAELKKEKNAYILAHNYAPRDIQDVADAVGDSLYLAQKGADSDADVLVEASVLFMNEILAILKKPGQRVLAPDGQGKTPVDMMQFRSTQDMVQFVRDTPQQVVILATEVGYIYPLSKAAPGKTILPASAEAACAFMKQHTLRKLRNSLRDGVHEIKVDAELAARARLPIERMLSIV
jgi:quinolinate synthase